jgi:hypothetical protein
MRIYGGRIPQIAEDIIRTLRDSEAIEVSPEAVPEAELDVQAVLREYLRAEREISTKARQLSDEGRGAFGRMKKHLAAQSALKVGEEALDYIVDQLIETFMHSHHIEEVFADDRDLRVQLTKLLNKHTKDVDAELDQAVRDRIKNMQEGSVSWDAEYHRVLAQLKRDKKLD